MSLSSNAEKVLITGGAGFIGSHISDKLTESGYDVIILDDLSSGTLENLKCYNGKVNFYQSKITDTSIEEIFAKEKPDYCIHLAAQTSVNHAMGAPLNDADINIIGSVNIFSLCKKYNVKKVIMASTAAVYGEPKYLPVDENHQTNPMSFYGLSKLTMENYVKLFDTPYIIFRFSNVYGPRQKSSHESGVIKIFHDRMIKGEKIQIYGDGEQVRDFVYVDDIAQVMLRAIESKVYNEIVNFSSNSGVTINELFDMMKEIYGYPYAPLYEEKRAGDIKDSILSNKKAKELFGDVTNTDLQSGLLKLRDECNL